MTISDRGQLEERLRAEIDAASRRLLETPPGDIDESLKRIETYSRLLNARPPDSRDKRRWAVAVAVGCLVVVSFLAVARTGDTKLLLDIGTASVAFQVADVMDWSGDLPLQPAPFRLDGLSSIEAPFFTAPLATPLHDGWLAIGSGRVALTRLQLAANGIVQLEHLGGRRFAAFFRHADLSGELQVLGELTLGVGKSGAAQREGPASLAVPESVPFFRRGEGIVPVAVHSALGGDWLLKDVAVRTLSFARETPDEPGTTTFVSSLTGGSIALPEVSREVMLRESDQLTLEGLSGLLVEARLDEAGIHLVFQGEAHEVRLGPPGFSRDLTPTYLEYLYHNQPLALFWGSASFIGGILWGIRQTLFG